MTEPHVLNSTRLVASRRGLLALLLIGAVITCAVAVYIAVGTQYETPIEVVSHTHDDEARGVEVSNLGSHRRALELGVVRAMRRAGVAEDDAPGFARDVSLLINAIASGCLRCEWAVYEANGGALDASLAQEYRDFVRTLPVERRPRGWENWSDYETLLHVNQPLARPWKSVATRQIRVLRPSDVEHPSNTWPPLDLRAVGRGPPAMLFPLMKELVASGADMLAVDVAFDKVGIGQCVVRYWFVRVGEDTWYNALIDTLVWPRPKQHERPL